MDRGDVLTIVPGQAGVIRLMPNDVRYVRPPVADVWSEVRAEPGRYEMPWPGDPRVAPTLAAVARSAREAPPADGGGPAAELDAAVTALLQLAQRLSAKGWGVGLLTPEGVVLRDQDGVRTAVPLDLGFHWTAAGPPPWDDTPGRPEWLASAADGNAPAAVWDRPPAEQQFAMPGEGSAPSAESDLRTLARVIAWCLTGLPDREPRSASANPAPVWGVLGAMLDGRIATPQQALDRLRTAPPSGHFARSAEPEPERPPAGTKSGPSRKVVGGVAAAVAAAAVAAIFFARPLARPTETVADDPTGSAPSPTPATPSSGGPSMDYQAIDPKNIAARLAAFPTFAKEAGAKAAAERAKLFDDWIDACETCVAGHGPAGRAEAGAQLRKLVDGFRAVHDQSPSETPDLRAKELSWLEQYDRHAQQLGW